MSRMYEMAEDCMKGCSPGGKQEEKREEWWGGSIWPNKRLEQFQEVGKMYQTMK
jgi:hypothetical protein